MLTLVTSKHVTFDFDPCNFEPFQNKYLHNFEINLDLIQLITV